jgi:hypothetical protein
VRTLAINFTNRNINIMNKYKVFIDGDNFDILLDGKVGKHGFFTTRFVEAKGSKEAEALAINLIRDELKSIVLNDRSDPPTLYVEENYEVDDFGDNLVPGTGFTWFKSEETKH